MDVNGLNIGMEVIISLVSAVIGSLGVWFKLKGKVELHEVQLNNANEEISELKEHHKQEVKSLHKRIDSQKSLIEKNRENSDKGLQEITGKMQDMELRIIKAIHEIKK